MDAGENGNGRSSEVTILYKTRVSLLMPGHGRGRVA